MLHTENMPPDASIDWSPFLNIEYPAQNASRMQEALSGQCILLTGAGGYIGSALARSFAGYGARHLVLLESAESSLYEIYSALSEQPGPKLTPILGSVCDSVLLREIFRQHHPRIIYHAAAFKHVPLMEQNPFAAVQNNAIGAFILAQTAAEFPIEQFLFVSTDKAADPLSIMGASKRAAELVLLSGIAQAISTKIIRLGNVLGSPGSVVPLFLKQIARGGPVTVTHPQASRYFVTLEQTVQFLLTSLTASQFQGILVPEISDSLSIVDLARFLIAQRTIPVAFTGLRAGEKLKEVLISRTETYASSAVNSLRSVNSPSLSAAQLMPGIKSLQNSMAQRDLPKLLQSLQLLVPEYEPATHLLPSASTFSAESA
jgi:FlaA1/EpsC-like NDP-sugar epimerase